MQKIKIVLTSFIAILMCLGVFIPKGHAANVTNPYGFSFKAGDILITKSTSASGIVGHSGIITDSTHVLHIANNKSYPKIIKISEWLSKYKSTKVIRPNNSTIGKKASIKAKDSFNNKKIPYKISSNPTNIKETYCSELVWYGYYKAGKEFKTKKNVSAGRYPKTVWAKPDIITPYEFFKSENLTYNGFKVVKTIKW